MGYTYYVKFDALILLDRIGLVKNCFLKKKFAMIWDSRAESVEIAPGESGFSKRQLLP